MQALKTREKRKVFVVVVDERKRQTHVFEVVQQNLVKISTLVDEAKAEIERTGAKYRRDWEGKQ